VRGTGLTRLLGRAAGRSQLRCRGQSTYIRRFPGGFSLELDEGTLASSGRSFPEMNKLIRGIIQFRETQRDGLIETFRGLALGQQPDALFIACSDSRMAVNVFASTNPGDLFVLRNVGNLVPPYGHPGATGTAAAVEFAVDSLRVRHIIVCGHSDCGAMRHTARVMNLCRKGHSVLGLRWQPQANPKA
jgi:hypothetical protein